ncbi:MAG TPA: diguanylate cyclase, partial [Solirubrobacteraceae bacterium]|nr:diguanylate cyclase [Solirubrobacteraceae bacterium]
MSATIIAPRDGGEPQGKPDSQDGEAVNTPDRQARQLAAIRDLGALERIGDPVLTALTRLARTITGAASAAVHILDDELQHRIAASGIALEDHPVNDSFCRLVVAGNQDVVTRDATTDGRFDYSPFVRDPVNPIRFYAAVPLHSATGVPIGTICAFDSQVRELDPEQLARLEDLAGLALAHLELMRVAAELGRAATLDPLTGATNRTIFDDRLAQALARRRRHGSKVLLAVLDLDDFKQLNDVHGHGAGDAALRFVARRLRDCVRSEDTVGRLGGDEFGVIAEVTQTEPQRLLAQLRSCAEGFEPALGLSVGA